MLLNISSKYQSLIIVNAKIIDGTQKKLSKKTRKNCGPNILKTRVKPSQLPFERVQYAQI